MNNYKLNVLAPSEATQVLEQIGINFEKYSGAIPLEINSDEDILTLGTKMLENADKNTIVLTTATELRIDDVKMDIPSGREEAKKMLKLLSGKKHCFITRMCIGGAGEPVEVVSEKTVLELKKLDDREITGYLSFEDYSYPGGYSPVGKGALFVRNITGDYNVIKGMPVNLLAKLLEEKYGITPVEGKNIWWKGSKE